MRSYVSFALLMKSLYVFQANNLLWLCTPNKLANMYKQMFLAFPPFITWSLSSKSFLCGSRWQSNIVPISQKQSNMNANLEWLIDYKQQWDPKIKILSHIYRCNRQQQEVKSIFTYGKICLFEAKVNFYTCLKL